MTPQPDARQNMAVPPVAKTERGMQEAGQGHHRGEIIPHSPSPETGFTGLCSQNAPKSWCSWDEEQIHASPRGGDLHGEQLSEMWDVPGRTSGK